MTPAKIAESALREIVAEARRKDPAASVVAVQAQGWNGKPTIALAGGEQLPVRWCRSVLELRQQLAEAGQHPVVLVTDREERELGEDVLAYLARGRLLRIGLWEPVKAHFKARGVNPRAIRLEWLPDALMRHMPARGYPPAASGVLTEEHALGCLSDALLGQKAPTAVGLLEAVSTGARAAALSSEPDAVVKALGEHHSARLGPVCSLLLAAARAGHGPHAVALGLVAQVAFAPSGETSAPQAQGEAVVRLERYTGGVRLGQAAGTAWGEAAQRLFSDASDALRRSWEDDARRLLDELELIEQAHLSAVLEVGFAGRTERAAEGLQDWLGDGGDEARHRALERLAAVAAHGAVLRADGEAGHARLARLSMAARLIGFVHSPEPPEAASLAEAARLHVEEGGALDLAREALDSKEQSDRLRRLFEELARAVDERRDARARRFARMLAAATAADSDDGLLAVERVLGEVVAAVARAHPTLAIVLDGMSEAAFRSIAPSIEAAGWRQVTPAGAARTPALAALPSVTKVSRASLLAGRLATGARSAESAAFSGALHDVGQARLFHKAEVNVGDEVRETLADSQVRVVGVVVNAIDDLLDRGDQVVVEWTLDAIGPLRSLLDGAAESGRAVVLASDHGHVLERGGEHRAHEGGGARWRPSGLDTPGGDEVLLRGRRVLEGEGAVIAPATERLRYRSRSAGYHGGATPQEVIAPAAVYVPVHMDVPGFEDTPASTPAWWELAGPGERAEARPAAGRPRAPATDQGLLFSAETPPKPARPEWIDRLLASASYRSQRERAHRPPADERVATLLAELDRRSLVAPERALAETLGVAPIRMRPMVASMQALLNLDGYRVLSVDPASGDVRLDRPLLEAQFDL
ncbi:MAG: BREX-2 system phosphatase PglZ [Actinomycetota bacterium]|nr:BREX-2 system phosphatase PglZ [Actinomycetota bacterium]